MTVAHLFFAVMTTAYILLAKFEETDLVNAYGDEYRRYQESVPMILPLRINS